MSVSAALPGPRTRPAELEEWYRSYYGVTPLDVSASGVRPYTLAELCALTRRRLDDLGGVLLEDSHALGAPRLRAAVRQRWGTSAGADVMVTHGSSEALFLVCAGLLRPGDEVVVTDPVYHSHRSIPESLGCTVRTWVLDEDDEHYVRLEGLARALSPATRAVLVNFPHNPTGLDVDAGQARELARMTADAGAWLVWDGAFEDLRWTSGPPPEPWLYAENVVRVGTLSKAYGLPGLRVGWCVGPSELLHACVGLRDATTLFLSPLVEEVAADAVEAAEALRRPRVQEAARNLAALREWAAGQTGLVEWWEPQGGVCAFPRLTAVLDDRRACRVLAEQAGVLLVPGSVFGRPGRVRLGFGVEPAVFDEALVRLAGALRGRPWEAQ